MSARTGRSPTKEASSLQQPVVKAEPVDLQSNVKGESDPESSSSTTTSTTRRNGVVKLEDLLPESGKELLGSVTFAPIRSSSSGPVRTSARVIQKMRQDNRPSTPPIGMSSSSGNNNSMDTTAQTTAMSMCSDSGTTNASSTVTFGGNTPGPAPVPPSSTSSSSLQGTTTVGGSSNSTGTNNNSAKDSRTEKAVSAPKTPTTNQSKQPKRLWSTMERSLFFEGLNEYGKDFEAITQHINQKMRRKVYGAEASCKSKEQIRTLYLQTFQKASRYLRFSDDVKKVPQELYALINYGEMRRKMPFMQEKTFMKLKELVYRGSVTIREKGKTIRIKTPSCRALKKLNQLEEWQEEVTLPQRIEINLVPATMESWGRVQSLAQNPRIKTTLPLYKRVSCLLKFLQTKWRSQEMRLCEKTMTYQPITTHATPSSTHPSSTTPNTPSSSHAASSLTPSTSGRSSKAHQKSSASTTSHTNPHLPRVPSVENPDLIDVLANNEPLLCLAPPAKTIIHRPMVNLTDFSNSYSICLNSYEDRIGAKCRGEELPVEKFLTHKERAMNGKRLRLDSGGEGGSGKKGPGTSDKDKDKKTGKGESNSDGEGQQTTTTNSTKGLLRLMDVVQSEEELARPNSPVDIQMFDLSVIAGEDRIDLFSDNSEDKRLVRSDAEAEEKVMASGVMSAKEASVTSSSKGGKKERGKTDQMSSSGGKNSNRSAASFKPLISDEVIRKIKEGWTVNTCGDLTFGDLYVMFGNDFKINLEYRWMPKEVQGTGEGEKVETEMATGTSVVTEDQKDRDIVKVDKDVEQMMGRRLGQLLMIANLMEKSVKKKDCACDRGGKMKENDYPYPESNLFKHPALPLRYSHYNGYNSMLQMRRQKPRQVYPFPSPKPFMSAPKYYHAGRPSYPRPPLPQMHDEAGRDGDAEDDGEEGTSSGVTKMTNGQSAGVKKVPVAVQTTASSIGIASSSLMTTEVTSTTNSADADASREMTTTDDGDEMTSDDEEEECEEEEEDYSDNPGLMSLLEISLPSIRGMEEELQRVTASSNETPGSNKGWLEDNINDYSFSSLLGHIDMHLQSVTGSNNNNNAAAPVTGEGDQMNESVEMGSENGSTAGEEEVSPEKKATDGPGTTLLRNNDMISDRCSVISETSVDFVKKFAEMAGMIQDH